MIISDLDDKNMDTNITAITDYMDRLSKNMLQQMTNLIHAAEIRRQDKVTAVLNKVERTVADQTNKVDALATKVDVDALAAKVDQLSSKISKLFVKTVKKMDGLDQLQMDGLDRLFNFFTQEAKANPWNLYPNFPEHVSTDLVTRIGLEWKSISQDSKLGFLIAVLTPYKRKVAPAYREIVVQLLEIALQDESEDVLFMAQCIKNWIDHGFLDLSVYRDCEAFKNIKDQLNIMMKDIKWIPPEVEFLSDKVQELYHLPDIEKEGLVLKEGYAIPSLQDRMKKYGIDILEPVASPVAEREKKTSASFLRRATSRGNITSPTSSFPKARSSSVKDSKAVILDLKELETLQMEQAKEKKKLEEDKLKKQKEKEDAREAKRLEKTRLEEEKKKNDQLKKEQDKMRKEKAEEERKLLLQKKKEMAAQKRQEDGEKSKRKGNAMESDAKKAKIAPSARVLEVIGNADLCTSEDIHLIEDFLEGRYKIHEEQKQICLTERIFEDDQGNSKKETIVLILDYSQCKWRKIRKTILNPAAVVLPITTEPPSTTEIPHAVETPTVADS